jgi:hypothetical protein
MLLAALAQPAAPAAASLPHQYVFILDTSFSMNRVAPATRAALRQLIAGGVQQRMQPGDRFELWTFGEQTYTRRYPTQTWTAEASQELAARAFAFINRQRFEKQGRLNSALAELKRVVQQAPALTAVILTDGEDTVRGTPFDAELNAAQRQRRRELRQAKQPMLIALAARGGRFSAWALSTPSEVIKLPPPESAAQPVRGQAAVAVTQPQPPQPAELKPPPPQPLPQPSPPPAPKPVALAQPVPAPAPTPTQPAREIESTPPPPVTPAQPAATVKEPDRSPAKDPGAGQGTAPQPAKAPLEPPPAPLPALPPPEAQKDGQRDMPGTTAASPPAEPPRPSAPPTPAPAPETAEAKPAAQDSRPPTAVPPLAGQASKTEPAPRPASIQRQATTVASATNQKVLKPPLQQTALVISEPPSPQRWLHLGLGAGLLAFGAWLCHWFVRRRHPTRPVSLISRSLERRGGKAGRRTE